MTHNARLDIIKCWHFSKMRNNDHQVPSPEAQVPRSRSWDSGLTSSSSSDSTTRLDFTSGVDLTHLRDFMADFGAQRPGGSNVWGGKARRGWNDGWGREVDSTNLGTPGMFGHPGVVVADAVPVGPHWGVMDLTLRNSWSRRPQHQALRFHDPPVSECTSMDVDDSSESRMSLVSDSLDHVYLGPDKELDSDSGSSRGPDVLDAIPDPSFPAQADDLTLFNDPDLYLGPEDDLIECDDAPAVPDSPMTGDCIHPISSTTSTPEPPSVHPVVSEAPMNYRLGDYQQCQGHIPHPTVAQLLEADRPFRMAWAETSDKL
ncbi:hypothetical protein F4604DRAFT_1689883 [Suillus subluteus]|nr:hypothetical protein F4604DRAFT_1689883 [Suillus subluteus]